MKKNVVLAVKSLVKKVVEYRIEDDCKVYTIKGTKLGIRKSLNAIFEKKWASIPVENNKIVFDNYMGNGYGCNGKYVTEELLKESKRYHLVWVVKDKEKNRDQFPEGVEVVEYMSPEAFQAYASARVWVCNYHMISYLNKGLQKKEDQVYIQLWHGSFGIKKIEGDCQILARERNWLYLAKKNAAITDYWISNSGFETEVYRQAFWKVNSVFEYGHPRNDMFFKNQTEISGKVRKRLGLDEKIKIALYVPTFRDLDESPGDEIDSDSLLQSLKERFGGEWKFLVRLHPRIAEKYQETQWENRESVNVSGYPDIQELLAAADVVVTDYSSCIFDFILTGRPGFIYARDGEEYHEVRGLYYPLEATPFLVAHNNRELAANIKRFDEKIYKEKIDKFLRGKMSVEDGNASIRVKMLIDKMIEKTER